MMPESAGAVDVDRLLTWQEASTSDRAIEAALESARSAPPGLLERLAGAQRILITGAGSSQYLALSAAAVGRELTGSSVFAAPLSEVVLRPDTVLGRDPATEPVIVVSRSGTTTEALEAARTARSRGHFVVAVTCRAGSALAAAADEVLLSPSGDERAIVMTRSFTSMLALLLRVLAAAAAGGDASQGDALARDLDALPAHWPQAVAAASVGRELGLRRWSRIVLLGGGSAFGVATEWGLKLTETSQIPAQAYEPLEFRHGPISICERGVLVVGLLGGTASAEESRVLAEVARLGATTWAVTQDPAFRDADATSVIGAGLMPSARLPLLLYPGQALALTVALAMGRNPDAPRHLGQVVTIAPA